MVRSMTGFGKAETVTGSRKITIEIRSLNSKQLDLSIKCPSLYKSLESDVRSVVTSGMNRGKVDVYINFESQSQNVSAKINGELFSSYCKELNDLAADNGLRTGNEVMDAMLLRTIMRMPEVMSTEPEEVVEEEKNALLSCLRSAVDKANKFRADEGEVLIKDILERVDRIEQCIAEIEPYECGRVDHIKTRIKESIDKAGLAADPNRLEQEMIYYVEKIDITEEKVRLAKHCQYFREVVSCEDMPGRKLAFISQEMGREINTLGSKANQSDIQRIVVGMKDELEKIKEQLLNIL